MSRTPVADGDSQFQSLLDTVEQLRQKKFPQLDATLVREILRLHASGGAPDPDIARAAEQAVERQVSKKD
jgi:hypothetical protein